MVASNWLRAAHRGVPHLLVTTLLVGQSPMALAESPPMPGPHPPASQANGGIAPAAMAAVLVGAVFSALLVWGVWAIRTAYVGWAENRLSQRQFLGVVVRFLAMYLVLNFFLLS